MHGKESQEMNCRQIIAVMGLLLASLVPGCAPREPTPLEHIEARYDLGDWSGTVAACTSLMRQSPDDVTLLYFRGRSFLALENYEAAVEDFSNIIRLQPEDPQGYYHRQLAYERTGESELAEIDANKGRSLDSLYKSAYQFEARNFAPPSNFVMDTDRDHENDSERPATDSEFDSKDESTEAQLAQESLTPEENDSKTAGELVAGELAPSASGPGHGEKTAAEPLSPRTPADPAPPSLAGDGMDPEMQKKLLAEQERQKALPDVKLPNGPPSLDQVPLLPPVSAPTISTALPGNTGAAPITMSPLPRTTGIQSRRPTTEPPADSFFVGPRQTGLDSRATPGIALPIGSRTASSAIDPGRFQGNTIFAPGTTAPTLSTSLPGTTPPGTPGKPVLSTQLPATHQVIPKNAPRPTGLRATKLKE